MSNFKSAETCLSSRENRRAGREDRFLDQLERRMEEADKLIGELVREGKTVYYITTRRGEFREGQRHDLVDFLFRNNYA